MARVVGKSAQYWSSFSPSNIPGLTLWYDFSDRSTIDLSGDYIITRVRDKSGKGFHGTPSNQSGVYWVYDSIANGVMRGPPTVAANLVLDICLNASVLFYSAAAATSGSGGNAIYVFGPRDVGGIYFRTGGTVSAGQTNSTVSVAATAIDPMAVSVAAFTGGTNMRVSANSVIAGNTNTFVPSPSNSIATPIVVGTYNSGTIRSYGSMYELLIYSNVLTDFQRGALEDYLTDKWMFSSNAPATITAPTDISGCNLWLDTSGGAANFTFAAGTSNIVKWIDKSPRNCDVSTVGTTTYPVWGDVSGYVYFNSGAQMNTNRPEPSNGVETGFMVARRVGNAVIRGVVNGGGTGSNLGPVRQLITYTNGYIIRLNNANPAVAQFSPTDSLGDDILSNQHDFSWRIKGKEFYTRCSGHSACYKASPNWADISAGGFTILGTGAHHFRELILFDRALSFSEMSNVSAYLTAKWGISNYKTFANPPSSNRAYGTSIPFMRPLQIPYDIPNCTLWLDAKDAATIQLDSSGNVLKWLDKSGWQNDVSAGGSRPSYSNETLVFSNNFMTVRNPNIASASNFRFNPPFSARYHTIVAVHKPTTVTGSNQGNTGLIDFALGYGNTGTSNVSFPTMDGTTPRGYVNSTSTLTLRTASTFTEGSVTSEYNIISASAQWNRLTIARNGVIQQDVSTFLGGNYTFNSSVAVASIGRWGSNNSNFYQGEVKEIMIFDRALSYYTVAQIEAYLAKKWNLTSLLPSNHIAFTANDPLTASLEPPAIEDIAFWVDAHSYAAEYSNNATITTNWLNRADKPSAVVPSGTPKFLSNAWQGRPGIDMTSGSFATAFSNDVSLTGLYHQTFIVASYNTGAPNTTRDAMFFRATGTTGPKQALLQVRPLDASLGMQLYTAAGVLTGGAFVAPPPTTAGTPFIYEVSQNSIFGAAWAVNGNTISNTSTTGALVTSAYSWAGIGQDSSTNTTPTWNGNIHEIITYAISPSLFDNHARFQIRAYLAQKWGLLGVLPTYPEKGRAV